jgi:hypothetical protein
MIIAMEYLLYAKFENLQRLARSLGINDSLNQIDLACKVFPYLNRSKDDFLEDDNEIFNLDSYFYFKEIV